MRFHDWPQLQAANVNAWRPRRFDYGRADCFQFAAAHVLAITGVDYRDRFPRYRTELGAARILARQGGVVGILTPIFGDPIPLRCVGRGDLVAAELEHGLTVGVCLGVYSCAPGAEGLLFFRTALAAHAWRIN